MSRTEVLSGHKAEPASQGGTPDALFQLGLMYCTGKEVPVNLIEAHKWFNLSTLQGHIAARNYRLQIASEMSKKDIAEAQRLAREWLAQN